MEQNKITSGTEVSTTELACVLGITGRRVRQLAEDGQLRKLRQGRFLLCEAVQNYISFSSGESESEEEIQIEKKRRIAEATLKTAKAQIAKMEAEELEGRMHRSEDVAAVTADLIYEIRGALMALPGRLAIDTAAADTPAETAEIVRLEVSKIMGELSKYRYDPNRYSELVRERRKWEPEEAEGETDEC